MNRPENLGDIIRQLREKKRLTQEQVAEMSGLHPGYVGSVERGEKNITVKTLAKITSALKIEIHELLLLTKVKASKNDISDEWKTFLKALPLKTSKDLFDWAVTLNSLNLKSSDVLLDWILFLKELDSKTSASLLELNQNMVNIFKDNKKRR